MDKKANSAFGRLGVILVLTTLAVVTFVIAHVVTINSTTTVTNLEDTSNLYNITVNLTEGDNITAVIIELYNEVNFTDDAEFNASVYNGVQVETTLTNQSLNFTNTTAGLLNLTDGPLGYFWFNATALAPHKYGNLSVTTFNSTGFHNQTNITLHINDTYTVLYDISDGANLSQDYIQVNVSVSGNDTDSSLQVRLFNTTSTAELIQTNGSGLASDLVVNFTGLVEGTYVINSTVNNSDDDENVTSITVRLDTTAPSVAASESTDSADDQENSIKINIDITESGSGIGASCSVDNSQTTIDGTGTSQTLTQSNLECGTTYTYVITCTDLAGNSGSVTATADTRGCPGGSVGGSSSTTTTSGDEEAGEEENTGGGDTGGGNLPEGVEEGEEGAGSTAGGSGQALGAGGTVIWVVIVIVAIALVWWLIARRNK